MLGISKWMAYLVIVLFLFWLFCFGGLIAGIALHDTDTCWLLAMGRWIIKHGALPFVDPFSSGVSSYDMIMPTMPLVQYQWLAEVIFYLIYQFGGLFGLLCFVSIVASVTFICLPYLFFDHVHAPRWITLWMIFTGAMLASSRLFVRPHILSFLFLAILIALYIPSKKSMSKFNWPLAISVVLLMVLWVNTHIFFPLGLVFVSLVLIARFIEVKLIDRAQMFSPFNFFMPLIVLLSTFVNPWGSYIWLYVQRLRNCPTNYLGQEMVPINLFDLHNLDSIFLLLLIISYGFICFIYSVCSLRKLGLVSPLLFLFGICMSLQYARLVPITSLFILAAAAELISRNTCSDKIVLAKNLMPIEQKLKNLISNNIIWLCTLFMLMILGTAVLASAIPPSLPQSSAGFQAPFKAIDFLKAYRPTGKVFNDPQFGSMMIWYLPNLDVFYDTRLSQYEPGRMLEYLHIKNCDPGYEKIWQKYNFDWVFVPINISLVDDLRNKGWQTIYSDNQAIIMTKP